MLNLLNNLSFRLVHHSRRLYRLSPYFHNGQKHSTALFSHDIAEKSSAHVESSTDCYNPEILSITDDSDVEIPEDCEEFAGDTDQGKNVGISQFLSDHEGFQGIIKHRPEDFIVNEILTSGQIVRLTDLGEREISAASKGDSSNEKVGAILKDHLTIDITEKILELHCGKTSDAFLININHLNKGRRSLLHMCFQKHLPNINVKVIHKNKQKYLDVRPSSNLKPQDSTVEELIPSHLHFVLSKVNKPSFNAYYTICGILNIPVQRLRVAGLKDKRAVTSQMISVDTKDLSIEKLAKINKCPDMKIGNFKFKPKPVSLGNLYGNHFEIVIRDVSASRNQVETALRNVKESGFINYFGLQRFGIGKASYLAVGRKLLQRDWQGAVELILQPRHYLENEKITECRRVWSETRNPREALKCLDNRFRFSREALLLKGLCRSGKNEFKSALKFIPKSLLRFYFNSYDSYLWNVAVSRRFEKHGAAVIDADYVRDSKTGKFITNLNEVLTVTKSSLRDCPPDISDVVFPIYGMRVPLPNNEIGDVIRELLAADGLNEDMVLSNELNFKYGLHRPLIAFPENMKWTFVGYDDEDECLSMTDYDKLQRAVKITPSTSMQRTAVKLEFDLSKCSYATMALREIMKT